MFEKKSDFLISPLPRCRWNVLDLVTIFARDAQPGYIFCNIDLSWADQLMSRFADQGTKVTVTAILIKAIALAQRMHPLSRSIVLPWGKKVTIPRIMAGFTVERFISGQPAVFFGTIENPLEKSIEQIAEELRNYGKDDIAQVPQLALEDRFTRMPWLVRQAVLWLAKRNPTVRLKYLGATFGLSSLGKFGAESATGPCVCTSTFGVGVVEQRPVVENDQIAIKPMLTLSLAFDARVMDNNSATLFMKDICKLIETGLEGESFLCRS